MNCLKHWTVKPTLLLLTLFSVAISSCQKTSPPFRLHIALRNAQPGTQYLYRLIPQQRPVLVDSFRHQQLDEDFTLEDPQASGEAIYQLSLPSLRTNLYFISDARAVHTYINGVNPRTYTAQGSAASKTLQALQQTLNPLQDSLVILSNKINNQIGDAAKLRSQALILRNQINAHYLNFVDTTSFALPAFWIAQQIDFGEDRSTHKSFIERMGRRFAEHRGIQDFVQKTKDFFALREVEYEIGETLPNAKFKDLQGQAQSPALWRGQYYLLQFWASYCGPCLADLAQKRAVYQKYQPQGFKMLTFSLDEDVEMLQTVLRSQSFPWPVVCDYKGWGSAGVNIYKIDSIPFNILVGPDGKVNLKNVNAIQLDSVLKHRVKVH